jgi:5-formyltetrahydrofolate cyclo-ligase
MAVPSASFLVQARLMTITARKLAMREEALARRAALRVAAPDAAEHMARSFIAGIPIPKDAVVSAFVAIGEETDPAPLIGLLRARGHPIALPRVVKKGEKLAFHLYERGAALIPGPFGLSQPAKDWPEAVPDVLVVPLLAFDARGMRLGYGGGFYDRTLADLRASRNVLAVGFAFAGQEVEDVPHRETDEPLDWVVTEAGARRFKPQV